VLGYCMRGTRIDRNVLSVDGKVNVCWMGGMKVARRLSGGCVAPPAAGMHLDRHLLSACTWPHRREEGVSHREGKFCLFLEQN
jgi:hypothetical protein